jgi:ubiquinone/menaquinone biosynthesis C-methylase UbiE
MRKENSWGSVAKWYDKHLENDDTYHSKVVLPNLLRVVDLKKEESLLELGCGQGFFLEKFFENSQKLTGVDLGKDLIKIAKSKNPKINFLIGDAEDKEILKGQKFDVITIILALQNMKNLNSVVSNLSRLLKEGGRVCIVLNHPAFRIPKKSSWGVDRENKIQYRRIDEYMTESEVSMDMTPGSKKDKIITLSYHRPLQTYSKAFSKEGFGIVKIEEWISHKKSEKGPMAKAEDKSRKEIPMFMCLVLKKM